MSHILFEKECQAIFFNNNKKAIQRMLDYDYVCQRKTPSVSAIIHPTATNSFQKFFFGKTEVIIPIYTTLQDAIKHHESSRILINFASFRSAYSTTKEALLSNHFSTISITAEGIPERYTRELNLIAKKRNITLIGPATVGAITPGHFKVGNIGGSLESIINSKLNLQGAAGLVTKSGGLFNELANMIANNSSGIAEGVAIGGDRFPGSSFISHVERMEKNPQIKYIVLLGEVGGTDEYQLIDAYKAKRITKPIIAWCIGTITQYVSSDIQFGHAGANASNESETADSKNQAMREAGFRVPASFNQLPEMIKAVHTRLVAEGEIKPIDPSTDINVPTDYNTAKKQGDIRKETNFICTISDDRGDEAVYAGFPISAVATPETGFSIADVITLLWFKKRYPKWASNFIETIIKTVADHGPAVSGAMNARVTARAGKDLLSCLASGLLTIGPRFGGAIDEAAKQFKAGYADQLSPSEFIENAKRNKQLISGIGHRIKSVRKPDLRVKSLKEYAKKSFPSTDLLNYALEVEKITSAKKETLILNVDGCIGVLMVDLWMGMGYESEQIDDFISSGTLNAFFALGRSIGFIGHILDEKRLNMPMYRHQFDDILYSVEKAQ
ncbi:MAG: ATP citrate synthase [Actinobacteria bacterium]|nr:ATP citrate synthase [Actinomycetota bacterium]